MNPKLTVTIDAKNRAITTASGMVTVGAKVDVVVVGLPDGIPDWGDGDAFTGPSIRLRIVDECGHDLVRYPLAEGDAWHSESETLSTSTPVEFDTDALRRAFCGVAFNEMRDFGLVLDSAVDDAQYAVGRIKVRQWAMASTEDPTVLLDWRETLAELRTNLEAVKDERTAAKNARVAAETAAADAAVSERTAATSATAAETAQNAARASELAAAKAADAAKAAQEGAEKAEAETGAALTAHMNDRGNPHAVTKAQVGLGNVDDTSDAAKPLSDATRAALAAKADLVDGKVPAAQLPSYVDDVVECDALDDFPATGERGKIYVALDTNLTYRWSGSAYVEISPAPDLTPFAKQSDLAPYAKTAEVTSAVNAEKNRAVAAENKKADKTTVSALSSAVDERRTKGDLAVYERVIMANVSSVDADTGSTTTVAYMECHLASRDGSSETYRGENYDGQAVEIGLYIYGDAIQGVNYVTYTDAAGTTHYANSPTYSGGSVYGSTGDGYTVEGYVQSPTAQSDKSLATTADVAAQAAETLASAKAAVREAAAFGIVTVAAGATLDYSTISRFTPSDAADAAFTLADPPAGKMAEYEVWVDCKTAAPASVVFKLSNAAKALDARVEGEVAAMEVGKTYVYRVQAFENPDANHVTVTVAQETATLADYSPEVIYAPNTAFEIDTTKGEGLTFALHAYRMSGYVTVYWGDGTSTRKYTSIIPAYYYNDEANFSHTYSVPGTYIIQIADSTTFSLMRSPMVVRALRWGDTVTDAAHSYTNCTNLTGTIPPWGENITNAGDRNYPSSGKVTSGAFASCAKLTGTIPPWPECMSQASMTFFGCSGLTGEIPSWPASMGRMSMCYWGCSGLTGRVPAWAKYDNLIYALGVYGHCTGLTGEIPPWPEPEDGIGKSIKLSWAATAMKDYKENGIFVGCTGLTGKIPVWPIATGGRVEYVFSGCTGLTGIWDENATDEEIMPSKFTYHTDCVTGASEAVRRHFTAEWGGTKEAATETTEETT